MERVEGHPEQPEEEAAQEERDDGAAAPPSGPHPQAAAEAADPSGPPEAPEDAAPDESPLDEVTVANVAFLLREVVEDQPYKRAVVYPVGWDEQGRVAYTHLTFQQLDRESDRLAHGLESAGITRGVRTILMVPPSLDFFVLTFALFKTGAVPVIVDPGMGVKRMAACLRETKPEAFIGIPKAHLLRRLYPGYFKTVTKWVTAGRRLLWSGYSLESLRRRPWQPFPIAETADDEIAAILFTSGSTGPAKGAVYTHGMFEAQVAHLKRHFDFGPDEIDLPTFPLFSLFDPALGMTAIIPDMDPTKPAQVAPEKIVEAIFNQGVTNMFASPALLKRVGEYGREKELRLPTLRRVVSAGAPVSPDTVALFSALLEEEAEIHTPYGATEALPVACISSHEILSETRKGTDMGFGMCVGRPMAGLDVRLITITDEPIEVWDDEMEVESPDIGEIVVKGDIVSRRYFERPDATAQAKIRDGEEIWHRMGDLGWQDSKGRIWFCGRKSHRVITENGPLYTIPCEAIFNQHPAVLRSALVGVGVPPRQKPVICIELHPQNVNINKEELKRELLNYAARNPMTKEITTIKFHKGFPVDVRHNAKIFREELAEWAK